MKLKEIYNAPSMIRVTMIFVKFKKYKYIRNVKIYEGNTNVMVYRILKVKYVLQHLEK